MNEKMSVFVVCVEAIIYLLLYSLHDCTFDDFHGSNYLKKSKIFYFNKQISF